MKKAIVAFVALAAIGCQELPQNKHYSLGPTLYQADPSVRVNDQRPADSRNFKGGEKAGFFSQPQPVYWYSDDQFDPPRITMLERKLSQKLGTRVAAKPIVVNKFEIVNFFPTTANNAQKSQVGAAMGFGLVGAVLGEVMVGDAADVDHVACKIQGTVDGKPFDALVRQNYKLEGWNRNVGDDPGVSKAVEAVVEQCTEVAVQKVTENCGC